ncbi:MAG: phosphoribosyltransferase [Anaerolineae bacterium]|nr:phosphoribosyltransferase [Anaerolineae bacterium]
MRREVLTWNDVDKLIDHLIPQFDIEFDVMVVVTRGGIIPGGMLAEALNLTTILTAAVDFPAEMNNEDQHKQQTRWLAWPKFIQFPEDTLLENKNTLVVDDVWGSGRTITAVKNRISAAGSKVYTCVLHFNPYRNLFGALRPDFYAATTDAYIIYPWEMRRGKEGLLIHSDF